MLSIPGPWVLESIPGFTKVAAGPVEVGGTTGR